MSTVFLLTTFATFIGALVSKPGATLRFAAVWILVIAAAIGVLLGLNAFLESACIHCGLTATQAANYIPLGWTCLAFSGACVLGIATLVNRK